MAYNQWAGNYVSPSYGYQGSASYKRDSDLRERGDLNKYISQAQGMIGDIEAGGASLAGQGAFAAPLAEKAITRALESPGMTAGEYAEAKGKVTGSFRAATGALGKAGGAGGYFSPSSAGQAAGNAPSSALAGGLGTLGAKNAEVARRERQGGLSALTSLTPTFMESARRPQEAYGQLVGDYVSRTPVNLDPPKRRYF